MDEKLNLEILNKSKKKKKPGDVFVLKPKGHDYYFGRIISVTADCGFGEGAILIYIYNLTSKEKYKIPNLNRDNLLIPPNFINALPWSKGYFETIESRELKRDDVLKTHCFKHLSSEKFYNEVGKLLKKKVTPIGFYGLSSYRTIDDDISEKLGIPLAPD